MKALMSKLGGKKVAVAAAIVIAGGGGAWFMKSKKGGEHAGHDEHAQVGHDEHAKAGHDEHATGFFARFAQAFESIQVKVDQIRRLDLENAKLKLENAQLKLKLESVQFEQGVAQSKEMTEQYGARFKTETGSKVGRTLASIGYRAPTHLLPKQLHALGLGYFKGREYEKAAVIFTLLSDLPKDGTYKTPAHHVLTGTAWFRLKNYEMADFYFNQALKAESEDALRYQAQARLWKAVIAHTRGKKNESQHWMQELVEHHPKSPEARWVNAKGGEDDRAPAHEEH